MPKRHCELCTRRVEHRRGLCRRCYRQVLSLGLVLQGFVIPAPRPSGPPPGTGARSLLDRALACVQRWSPEVREAFLAALQAAQGRAA